MTHLNWNFTLWKQEEYEILAQHNNGNRVAGGGSVKHYVIIKGGFGQSLQSLTEGGRRGQKSGKLPYVIYECSLNKPINIWIVGKNLQLAEVIYLKTYLCLLTFTLMTFSSNSFSLLVGQGVYRQYTITLSCVHDFHAVCSCIGRYIKITHIGSTWGFWIQNWIMCKITFWSKGLLIYLPSKSFALM